MCLNYNKKITILSKNQWIYSTESLMKEFSKKGIESEVINPLECDVGIDNNEYFVYHNGKLLNKNSYILPRIGSASYYYGIYVLEAFEKQGFPVLNKSENIIKCRNKFKVYQQLQEYKIPTPKTFLVKSSSNVEPLIERLNGFPVIVKLTRGSQGKGIMLAESLNALKSIIDAVALFEEDIIIQEYFKTEPANSDIRVYVLDNKIIGSTQRINKCDFRSNTHCGGKMTLINIDDKLKELALLTANKFGLTFCSIDYLVTEKGHKTLEINSTPGFEMAEKQANLPLASILVEYIENNYVK